MMEKFAWSPSYSVGIKSLDSEHQALFAMFNKLADAWHDNADSKELLAMLREYIDAVAKHFTAEEKLLERYAYLGLAKQRSDHQQIISRMKMHLEKLSSSAERIDKEVLDEIAALKVNHIRGADQAYAEFLQGQGMR